MPRSPLGGFGLLLACALAGLGCKQGVGGRCVQNSDCESGICSVYGVSASSGHCEATTPTSTGSGGSSAGGASGSDGVGGSGGVGGTGGAGTSDGAVDSNREDALSTDTRADLGTDR